MRPPSSPVLAVWFWLSYVAVSTCAALIEMLGWHLTDQVFGPESMWNIVTLPAGLAVLGALGGATCVAIVRRRWPQAGDQEPAARPGAA